MKNILIVDDDDNTRRSLRTMLQLTGHRALTAADGLEAIATLRHEPVDVIISDLVMPRMDGYRLCQMVRQDERCKAVPFIFHTTYTSPADEKLAVEVGADEFLRKPADMNVIQQALQRAFAKPHIARPESVVPVPEDDVLRAYSDRLVARLEETNTELQAAQEKLQQLLAHSQVVLYTLKLDGHRATPQVISDSIESLLGVTRAESARYAWWLESMHPDDRGRVLATITEGLKGYRYLTQYRLRHKDGTYRWVEDSSRVVRDTTGHPKEMVGVWTDITERRMVEEQLREQAALLNLTTEAIIVQDLSRHITYWNKGAERLYGWTAAEAIGQTPAALFDTIPWSGREAALDQLMEQGTWQGDLHQGTKHGGRLLVHSQWTLMSDERGKPRSVLVVNSDVTELKRAEARFLLSRPLLAIDSHDSTACVRSDTTEPFNS